MIAVPAQDVIEPHTDDAPSCPDCGGAGGHLSCVEGFCTCTDGDECWVPCPSCEGEG